MEYGFQYLALIGSANYDRAILPLHAPVSLIGENNKGKTSLINALQFMLIIDQRRMNFGAHSLERSKQFYFPANTSYILLEALLPQTGVVVLGCVGKGVSHDYEYFAYTGALDLEDFRLPNGAVVPQPRLVEHLAARGHSVFRYTPGEFRDLVYGSGRRRRAGEPEFGVFRLEHASDAKAYQQVLTRTLRLDRLTSDEVKSYLLEIFRRDLPDADIDFKREWDKAFAEVHADRAQYQAALKQRADIEQMARMHDERLMLRGKVTAWRPAIDAALEEWESHYTRERQQLIERGEQIEKAQAQLLEDDRARVGRRSELEAERKRLDAEQEEQAALERRFALIDDRRMLETAVAEAGKVLERHLARLAQAEGYALADLERERADYQTRLQKLEQRLQNLDDNLERRLQQTLPPEVGAKLAMLLCEDALAAGPARFELDSAALGRWLQDMPPPRLRLPGLDLDVSALTPRPPPQTAEALHRERARQRRRLRELDEQIEIARGHEAALRQKQALEQARRDAEQALEDYDRLLALRAGSSQRAARQAEIGQELAQIQEALDGARSQSDRLRQEAARNDRARNELDAAHERIGRLREARADRDPVFEYLPELPARPWLEPLAITPERLADALQTYQEDCRRLLELNRRLEEHLTLLHAGGLSKFQYAESPEEEIRHIIAFSQQLDKEAEALEKKARSAVVTVTAGLRELRDGLGSFQSRLREFNKLIGLRKLSDLDTFRIEAVAQTRLVEAIDVLINTAERVDSGDSFSLFDQASVLDDAAVDRARRILIEEGEARQGLKVSDLFRLEFVIGRKGERPENFADLDSAASNGTVLMAKLITGLAMLYQMQNKNHRIRAVAYLDEALALDRANQRSLIAVAEKFGFSLIFASPAPLDTVRYCVPIQRVGGRNHISSQGWQELEPLQVEQGAAS